MFFQKWGDIINLMQLNACKLANYLGKYKITNIRNSTSDSMIPTTGGKKKRIEGEIPVVANCGFLNSVASII